jgi:hypothetical protein
VGGYNYFFSQKFPEVNLRRSQTTYVAIFAEISGKPELPTVSADAWGGAGFSDPVPQDDGAAFAIPLHL